MYLLADLIFIVVALLGAAFLGFILGRRSLRRRFARVQTQEQEQEQALGEALAQLKRSKDRRTALQRELSEVRTHLSASAIDTPRAARTVAATERVGAEANESAPSQRRGSPRNPRPATSRNSAPPPRASRPASKPASKQDEALARVRARATKLDLSHLGTAEANRRDDLKQIDGIGIFTEKKLNALGIYTIGQVANLRPEDERRVNAVIELPRERIAREQWVEQAKRLVG
ncbi:MAG: hypothetical protein WA960_11065 [Tunicatimonas sp.]